eukprot:CAMPEP_0172195690 /NCGR_PEP_ID=MMETSP1050-20130122/26357_1 /TAXON_ID=233186 /ORGANISM="Cryptomonas curvata, Strain CCAP979/52" /LENGTH=57 /DNA_ID=CAMNT_0012871799 /DNA_START=30 /DNA_END=203 /DNA_ORIENTATION=+
MEMIKGELGPFKLDSQSLCLFLDSLEQHAAATESELWAALGSPLHDICPDARQNMTN